MNEWIQRAIVYIDLVVTGSEAHNSLKASQGGGDLWIGRGSASWIVELFFQQLIYNVKIGLRECTKDISIVLLDCYLLYLLLLL